MVPEAWTTPVPLQAAPGLVEDGPQRLLLHRALVLDLPEHHLRDTARVPPRRFGHARKNITGGRHGSPGGTSQISEP